MKIIIIGAGKVGYTLAENLVAENNDVTLIDKSINVIEKVEDSLDAMCIKGNGVSTSVLLEAGIEKTDLLIAVTGNDEINMVCCLTAKKLGALQTVARVRNPEYADELSLIKDQLGLDFVINPEFAAAEEIARTLGFSSAINVERFASGRVRMVELKITSEVHIIGKRLSDINKHAASSVVFGVIVRGDEIIVPKGESLIRENDVIYVIGKSSNIFKFCKACGKSPERIKNVMIMGGGRIAYYLYKLLTSMNMNIKIIEINRERCYELSDELPSALIINSDGTEEDALLSENIKGMDSFVAITGMDEQNLMSSLIAKKMGVKISCDLNYRNKLWSKEKAGQVMGELCKYVDVCIANEEDAADVFGIRATNTDVTTGAVNHDGYKEVAKQLAECFGFEKVAITLRESLSANDNLWSAMLYDGENYHFSKKYKMHIVDRVGGGDSFGGGLIAASLNGYSAQDTIEFAVAASCLKHSIEGDFNMVSMEEVRKLAGGDGSGRVQR